MGLEDDMTFFEQVPTLSVLGKQALRILAIGAETRQLQSGAVLYYAGDLADAAYLVQEGSLLLEPGVPTDSKEFTVGPGTLVGELALISDTVCPMTATAQEPTLVIRISRNLFRKTLEGYPAAAMKLRDMMAARLDDWTRELVAVRQTMDIEDD